MIRRPRIRPRRPQSMLHAEISSFSPPPQVVILGECPSLASQSGRNGDRSQDKHSGACRIHCRVCDPDCRACDRNRRPTPTGCPGQLGVGARVRSLGDDHRRAWCAYPAGVLHRVGVAIRDCSEQRPNPRLTRRRLEAAPQGGLSASASSVVVAPLSTCLPATRARYDSR